jgi:sugar transferase (PEP-CTERM system associated)
MYRILTGSFAGRRVGLVVVEHLLIVLAVFVAAVLRLGLPEPPWSVVTQWGGRAVLVAVVLQISLHYADLYDLRTLAGRRDLLIGVARALAAASMILAIIYYLFPGAVVGRGVFAIASVLIAAVVIGWRTAFDWLSLHGEPSERLLIVGTDVAATTLARELRDRRSELGVEVVGFVDAEKEKVGTPLAGQEVLGLVRDIPSIVKTLDVDRVVVSLTDARGKFDMAQLVEMKLNDGVRFDYLASVYEEFTGKIAVENLRPSWILFSSGFTRSVVTEAAKRAADVGLSLVGLVMASPLMLMSAVAIKAGSPGPVLYSQQRVGRNGVPFTVHKFRSMRVDAEATTGPVWSSENDPRVTRVGRVLRRTRLDELPQLWSVLRGDMSFVGPRPERPEFVANLTKQIPYYGQRHVVRPGLTGWAQVRHGYGSTIADAQQKLQYDLFYIKHLSLAFDFYIIAETVKTVLVRSGS